MALMVGDREVRPLTADEVLRMVDLGILDEDEPVELLDGALTRVSPKSPGHEVIKSRLLAWLDPRGNRDRFEVRVEGCLIVPDITSLPEPDVMVIAPCLPITEHPASARLVIEIAASSLRTDLRRKRALYASAAVPEYWVVDVPGQQVHVFRPSRTR